MPSSGPERAEQQRAKRHAIIGIEGCGCITFIETADELDAHSAEAVNRVVARGGRVLNTTLGEAEAMDHYLPSECPHDPKGWGWGRSDA